MKWIWDLSKKTTPIIASRGVNNVRITNPLTLIVALRGPFSMTTFTNPSLWMMDGPSDCHGKYHSLTIELEMTTELCSKNWHAQSFIWLYIKGWNSNQIIFFLTKLIHFLALLTCLYDHKLDKICCLIAIYFYTM